MPAGLLRRLPGSSALFLLEPTFPSAHQFSSRLQLDRDDLGAAEALAERIELESKQAHPGHEAVLLGLLIELVVFRSRGYGESDVHESRARCSKLESSSPRSNGVSMSRGRSRRWRKLAHVSRTNLLRVFRRATGKSPIDYLIGLRIEAAKRLLRQSGRSMTEIALETGFGDSNYFARQFHLVTGRTPSEFRRAGRLC